MDSGGSPDKYLSATQEHNYIAALTRVYLYQNRDGSWGRDAIEKVTWTSQAIQLMHALKLSHDDLIFKNAKRWMEDNVSFENSHWLTRVEVGLKIGDFEKLCEDGYIDKFISDLQYDLKNEVEEPRLDFFWHVIPTLIALIPYEDSYQKRTGNKVPHDKVIKRLEGFYQSHRDDYITIKHQTNHTGLVALYLFLLSEKSGNNKYKADSDKMIDWLLLNMCYSDEGIYWQDSKSVTSYVLMDLLKCIPNSSELKQNIPKILQYLTPSSRGSVKRDKVTTFGTKLHADPLYITILVLRALVEVLRMDDENDLSRIREAAKSPSSIQKGVFKVTSFFSYHRKKFPGIMTFFLCLIGFIIIKGHMDVGLFFFSIAIGGAIGPIYNWLLNN